MTEIDSMAFARFLFDQLKGSKLREEVPDGSLRMICERTAGYYLADGVFNAQTLIDWVVADYSFSREEISAIVSGLAPAAARMGVKLGFGGPDQGPPAAPPRQSVPGTYLPVDRTARPSVERILLEEKLWESMFSDFVFKGQAPGNKTAAKVLENLFTFSSREKEYYSVPPQSKTEKTMASWIVQVNGKALAYEFANFAVLKDTTEDREGLARALNKFMEESAAINAKVKGMIERAKQARVNSAPILDLAWERLQKAQKKIARHGDELDCHKGGRHSINN